MKIMGVSGTNGSGKDLLGDLLAKYHGFMFVTVSDFLRQEAKKRGLEPSRENLRTISAQWRREKGLGVLVDMAVEKFKQANGNYSGLVLGPMRNAGEAKCLKELGGTLVWVDADPQIRYQRITSRRRDGESRLSFEQFIAQEQAEMQRSGDEATLGMAEVKELADIRLENDFDDVNQFRQAVEEALKRII